MSVTCDDTYKQLSRPKQVKDTQNNLDHQDLLHRPKRWTVNANYQGKKPLIYCLLLSATGITSHSFWERKRQNINTLIKLEEVNDDRDLLGFCGGHPVKEHSRCYLKELFIMKNPTGKLVSQMPCFSV